MVFYTPAYGKRKSSIRRCAVSGDQAQIDNIKKRIVNETKTASLVSGGDLASALSLTAALRFRYDVTPVTIENFTATINKITNEPTTYKLRAVLSFARNDEEQNKIRELIKGAIKDDRYQDLVFIDASSTVLGGERSGNGSNAANEDTGAKDGNSMTKCPASEKHP
jgi:hypothetical protein